MANCFFILIGLFALTALSQDFSNISHIVSIPRQETYLLPPSYVGNRSASFIDTNSTNSTIQPVFTAARASAFISYSSEFDSLLGPSPSVQLIATNHTGDQFFEAGVWVPDRNEVWFTSAIYAGYAYVSVLNLTSNTVYQPNLSLEIPNANGGYYFNGLVYFTAIGSESIPGGIYSVDPSTGETNIVVNTYFGLRLNGPDDVAWAKPRASDSSAKETTSRKQGPVMFFTDPDFRAFITGYTAPLDLPNAVWRFDPAEQSLTAAISRADVLVPNGCRVNANSTALYITDTTYPSNITNSPFTAGPAGGKSPGSPAIYRFDLDAELRPSNKTLVALPSRGVPDGIHIDDAERIWTGEGDGVVVRNSAGTILGVFNKEVLLEGGADAEYDIANICLAGDKLVIFALQRLWLVQLTESVISPDRYSYSS